MTAEPLDQKLLENIAMEIKHDDRTQGRPRPRKDESKHRSVDRSIERDDDQQRKRGDDGFDQRQENRRQRSKTLEGFGDREPEFGREIVEIRFEPIQGLILLLLYYEY